MAKGREQSANNVRDVLDAVLNRQQQGVISLESQQGNTLEEGEIYIQNQQVTYARTRQAIGQAALQEMLNWRFVRFSFEQPQRRASITSIRPTGIAAADVQAARPFIQAASNTDSLPPATFTPPAVPQITTAPPSADARREERTTAGMPRIDVESSLPGLEWIVPRRIGNNRDVLSLPLTRPQRSIYLLVDGHRSIGDIARCTRKSMQEVEHLLREMQAQSIVGM